MKKLKTQKGITLIALIITIIVMLILVGVTVSIALNGGLFKTAKQATKQTEMESEKERLLSIVMGSLGNDGKVDFSKLDAKIQEDGTFEKTASDDTTATYTTKKTKNKYTVSLNGSITADEILPVATNVKVVSNSDGSGDAVAEDSTKDGVNLYLTFTPTVENGTVTNVQPSLPFAVTKNGYYKFQVTYEKDGKEYTKPLEVAVNQYKYKFQKINYDELSNGTKTYTVKASDSGASSDVAMSTENLDWRLFKITDDGKILLVPAGLITNSSLTLSSSKNAFVNGPDLLNTICDELYGKGTYASGARSATVEDFNEFTGYDPNTNSTTLDDASNYGEYGKYYYYRIWNSGQYSWYWIKDNGNISWNDDFTKGELNENNKTNGGPTSTFGVEFINPEANQYVTDITKQEVRTCFRNTAYEYKIVDYFDLSSLTIDLGLTDAYKIYNSIKDAQFWLASRYTLCGEWRIGLGLRAVNTGKVRMVPLGNTHNVWNGVWSDSETAVTERSYKLCPIVELDASQVELTKSNKTWQISAKQ